MIEKQAAQKIMAAGYLAGYMQKEAKTDTWYQDLAQKSMEKFQSLPEWKRRALMAAIPTFAGTGIGYGLGGGKGALWGGGAGLATGLGLGQAHEMGRRAEQKRLINELAHTIVLT